MQTSISAPEKTEQYIGKSIPRVDAREKVSGKAIYLDDLVLPELLHGAVVLSEHPHGILGKIDTTGAQAVSGVVLCLTASDIPGENQIGGIVTDQPLLATGKVRFRGEPLALVCAVNPHIARRAVSEVRVHVDPLPGVFSPEEALRENALPVHDGRDNRFLHLKIRKGDVEQGFRDSDFIVEERFTVPHQEHMYLEPQGAVAIPEGKGSITIYGTLQCPFYVQKGVATVLGIPLERVTVIQTATGGGFGGKEEVPTQIAAFAALLALRAGKPVKVMLSREEDTLLTSKRHPLVMNYRAGVSSDGKLLAMKAVLTADGGAYTSLSPVVLFRSTVHATGPYDIPNVCVDTFGCHTNHPPTGAFRGFGQPQVTFACEAIIDELAYRAKIDPIELRLKNILRVDSTTATGQVLKESVGLEETILKARELSGWNDRYIPRGKPIDFSPKDIIDSPGRLKRRGIGAASSHYGVSLGAKGKHIDRSSANLVMSSDGHATVEIGGTEMGQGAYTVVTQIAAEALGIPPEWVRVRPTSTSGLPDCGPTVASRLTLFSGNAVLKAANVLRARILEVAGDLLEHPPERLTVRDGKILFLLPCNDDRGTREIGLPEVIEECSRRGVELRALEEFCPPDTSFADEDGQGDAYFIYSFTTHIAEVEVDLVTGKVKILHFNAAQDVGKAIFPIGVEGQMEGGILQGIGYALYEDFRIEKGEILTGNFSTYIVPTALDTPEKITLAIVEEPTSFGPFGAKGVGEPALIPASAAVANAVSNALGIRFTTLPITPERVLRAIYGRKD